MQKPTVVTAQAVGTTQVARTASSRALPDFCLRLLAVFMLVCVLLLLLVVTSPSYPWALAILGFLAVAGESFIPVLPLGPLVAVNVLVLNVWDGFLVSYLGALVGSSAGYWFARTLGRGWVMQRFPVKYRGRIDKLAAETSFTGLLLAWFVPGVNCVVSCASGVGGVRFSRFLVTCALGLFPWVALYAVLAHDLARAGTYGVGFTTVAVLLGAVYLAGRWCRR